MIIIDCRTQNAWLSFLVHKTRREELLPKALGKSYMPPSFPPLLPTVTGNLPAVTIWR